MQSLYSQCYLCKLFSYLMIPGFGTILWPILDQCLTFVHKKTLNFVSKGMVWRLIDQNYSYFVVNSLPEIFPLSNCKVLWPETVGFCSWKENFNVKKDTPPFCETSKWESQQNESVRGRECNHLLHPTQQLNQPEYSGKVSIHKRRDGRISCAVSCLAERRLYFFSLLLEINLRSLIC